MSLDKFIEKIGVNDFKWRNVKNIVGIARDEYNNEDFPAENVIYVRIEDLDKSYIGARKRITFVFANSRRTSRYNGFFNEGASEECEKCGDPACKDGEICGLKEEIKLEKDLLGRTVIAEEDLDEFEPEADGSEYYGKVMEKVEAIVDDPVCEDDDVDECDIAEMIELGKKIR